MKIIELFGLKQIIKLTMIYFHFGKNVIKYSGNHYIVEVQKNNDSKTLL